MLLGECRILSGGIEADAQDLDIPRTKLLNLVAEPATFCRSTRGVGLWIEPQQHFFPAEICEREVFPFVCLYGELWSWGTDG